MPKWQKSIPIDLTKIVKSFETQRFRFLFYGYLTTPQNFSLYRDISIPIPTNPNFYVVEVHVRTYTNIDDVDLFYYCEGQRSLSEFKGLWCDTSFIVAPDVSEFNPWIE